MGMHSGLDNPADLNLSNVSHRVIYSGVWVPAGCSILQASGWQYVALRACHPDGSSTLMDNH